MPANMQNILSAAQAGFALLDAQAAVVLERRRSVVMFQRVSGTGNIGQTFGLDRRFRLVCIRCHFTGSSNWAAFQLSLDSGAGSAYDAALFTITQAGPTRDVNLRISGEDLPEPSAWTFEAADRLRIDWTDPNSGSTNWGLEVGLAPAL